MESAQVGGHEARQRLIDAFTKLAGEGGFEVVRGSDVAAEAGLPEEVFNEHFPSELHCLVAAHDAFYERLEQAVEEAIEGEEEWAAAVRTAVSVSLESLADSGAYARLFAVDAVRAGPMILERRFTYTSQIAERLREGRRHYPNAEQLVEATEWRLVAGVIAGVTSHLLAEQGPFAPEVAAELTEFLLIPYLGPKAAAEMAGLEESDATES